MLYNEMSRDELVSLKNELEKKYEEVKSLGLSLDMSRGKPGADQLDLSVDMPCFACNCLFGCMFCCGIPISLATSYLNSLALISPAICIIVFVSPFSSAMTKCDKMPGDDEAAKHLTKLLSENSSLSLILNSSSKERKRSISFLRDLHVSSGALL